MVKLLFFFIRGLITASLKVFGTYPNENDELMIFKRGSITSGSTSFRSLDRTGSNIQLLLLFLGGSIAYYLMR